MPPPGLACRSRARSSSRKVTSGMIATGIGGSHPNGGTAGVVHCPPRVRLSILGNRLPQVGQSGEDSAVERLGMNVSARVTRGALRILLLPVHTEQN